MTWTQADPQYRFTKDAAWDHPRQGNLYDFDTHNPLHFVDPDGRGVVSFCRDLAADAVEAGGAVVGGVVGAAGGAVVGLEAGGPVGAIYGGYAGGVAGAGFGASIANVPASYIRGETPTVGGMLKAMGIGATGEMGGQILAKGVGAAAAVTVEGSAAAKTADIVSTKSAEEMAADLAEQAGKNRVSANTAGERVDIDLRGKAHYDEASGQTIATPHVHTSKVSIGPNGKTNLSSKSTRPATKADIRTARKILERRKNKD